MPVGRRAGRNHITYDALRMQAAGGSSGGMSSINGTTFGNQSPHYFFAGPATGTISATPAFRAMVATDLPAHNILSAAHGDTTTASAVRGDVITAQGSPPLWTRLAIGVPTTGLMNYLGVAYGDTEPGYKGLFDATVPGTITAGASATTGTATVAARIDHVHGAPTIWTATAHNLLSAIHGDTTAASAVRGDIITSQGTAQLWTRLAISAPASTFMNYLGVAYGDTEPGYKGLFDATVPGTITVGATATTGTATVAARRDHVHGAPSAWAEAHNLLSSSHSDSLATAVTDGAIIIGNATPKWSSLAISVPAAACLNILGVANAELRPSWKALFDAEAPEVVGATVAPDHGEQIISARRDHKHGILTSSNPGTSEIILATAIGGSLTLRTLTIGTSFAASGSYGFCGTAPSAQDTGWAVTAGYTADRTFDPEITTETTIARVLGTLIDALKAKGIIGA